MGPGNASDLLDQRLGIYQIEALLGARGVLAAYRARDIAQGRPVVLHVLFADQAPEPQQPQLFRAAVERITALKHPHIAPAYEIGDEGNLLYVVGQPARESVSDRLVREGMYPPVEAARLIAQCAWALFALHNAGVGRFRLTPENILLADPHVALLADTSVARSRVPGAAPTWLTVAGLPMGVFQAMVSKRAAATELDRRDDVRALGAILYRLLTNTYPDDNIDRRDLAAVMLTARLEPTSKAPRMWPELEEVVMRSLSDDAGKRYPDARAFAVAVRHAIARYDDGGADRAPVPSLVNARRTPRPLTGGPAPFPPEDDQLLRLNPAEGGVSGFGRSTLGPAARSRQGGPSVPLPNPRSRTPSEPFNPRSLPGYATGAPASRPSHGPRRLTQPPVFNPNDPLVNIFKTQPPALSPQSGNPATGESGPRSRPSSAFDQDDSLVQLLGRSAPSAGPLSAPGEDLSQILRRPTVPPPPADAAAAEESVVESLRRHQSILAGNQSRRRGRRGRARLVLATLLALAVLIFGGGTAFAVVSGSATATPSGPGTKPTAVPTVPSPPATPTHPPATHGTGLLPAAPTATVARDATSNPQAVIDRQAAAAFRNMTLARAVDSSCQNVNNTTQFSSGQTIYVNLCAGANAPGGVMSVDIRQGGQTLSTLVPGMSISPGSSYWCARHGLPSGTYHMVVTLSFDGKTGTAGDIEFTVG